MESTPPSAGRLPAIARAHAKKALPGSRSPYIAPFAMPWAMTWAMTWLPR